MDRIVAFIVSYGGLLASLSAAALWLWARPASRAGRRFLIAVVAAYTLASIYAVPYVLSRPLLAGYHALSSEDIPRGRIAIVVLSAGSVSVEDWTHRMFFYLDTISASRMWETHRVYRLAQDAWVISSETSGDKPGELEQFTPAKRDALVQLGIPASRIVVVRDARNTYDEAVHMAPIIRSLNVDRVVLVTSEIHVRRSLGAFRSCGVDAIPAIMRDPGSADPWRDWILPTAQGLGLTRMVVHEALGLVYNAVHGRR